MQAIEGISLIARGKAPEDTMQAPRSLLLEPEWPEYELLDSGNRMRLERFGEKRIARSEPKAWWKPDLPQAEWDQAEAVYDAEGNWTFRTGAAREWVLRRGGLCFLARFTGSKHVGVFPEQAPHWAWIEAQAQRPGGPPGKVLSLFGYTGAASLVAAQAGFHVTHVDASKPAIAWGRENVARSGKPDLPIRWLLDDARKFVARELRRGSRYEGILMDPPSFGRGPKSEVWKVEDQLPGLLEDCVRLLDAGRAFLVVTLYSIAASPYSIGNLLVDAMGSRRGNLEIGELALRNAHSEKRLALSIFGRWASL